MASNSDFATKLLEIYNSRLAIRAAINAKGVILGADVPFPDYAGKILLIQGDGDAGSVGAVTSIKGLTENFTIGFILPQTISAVDIAALIAETTGSDSFAVVYPPVTGTAVNDIVVPPNTAAADESASVIYTLFAFAESFKPSTAYRYDYNADWVEFSENGVYVKDRTLVNTGESGTATENGVYFSVPLPNRQSYANIINLSAKAIRAGLAVRNG